MSDFPHDAPVGTVACAWDFIGYDGDHYLRIVGGRAKYETVIFNDATMSGKWVRLARLDGLHQVDRRVDPDVLVEVVA